MQNALSEYRHAYKGRQRMSMPCVQAHSLDHESVQERHATPTQLSWPHAGIC